MVNPYYHRLTSLFAQQQKYHRPWQMNIYQAMERLRAQLAQDLGVSQQYYQDGRYRYVEWKTPSREDFCLDAPRRAGPSGPYAHRACRTDHRARVRRHFTLLLSDTNSLPSQHKRRVSRHGSPRTLGQ